ncbi:Ku protein [Streptomyces sp. NPDC050439]|uniref:non-homologous end joining protein Ku n=1 Tax=unclassified Streptomyces TaxID=2593676 RepID=UPI003429DEAB
MRSIWNGAISFGLVSIPIKLMNATENHAVSFRQIHTEDGGRVRYRKVCELEEREVTSAEIGKGYEEPDGTVVPITDEDLAALPLPTAKTIEIVAFVPAGEVDPMQMDTAYYLSANGVPATKPYTLLREALKRSEKVAIARYALRGRERLGMLRVVDDVIAMHALLWPDEIRDPEGVAPDTQVKVRDAELDLADALMDTLGEVDVSTLHDDYRAALEELLTAKAEGTSPAPPATDADSDGGKVIDLVSALEKSVRAAKTARDDGSVADVTPLERGGRKKAAAASKRTPSSSAASSGRAKATPKDVGGKKSTAKKAGAAKAGTAKASTAKANASTAAKKTPAKKAATKNRARA